MEVLRRLIFLALLSTSCLAELNVSEAEGPSGQDRERLAVTCRSYGKKEQSTSPGFEPPACLPAGLRGSDYPPRFGGGWTKFHKSDPRIALGKYSPLEKEILKKVWMAQIIMPAEEFRMPQREKINISKHVERMQLARALGSKQVSSNAERLGGSVFLGPTAKGKVRKDDSDYCDNLKQEEKKEEESKVARRQEIKMKVAFKSKEPRRCLPCQPNDRKPFFPIKTLERSITGLTNRNLLSVAEFPRDLMLMNQDFISREIYSRNVINTHPLQEGHACKECVGKAAPHNY
ncbi:hypothetical protein GW7_05694 [Heterocephalus glaber]|uniref:Uncharacterized protein n=1 Tax=Heterocephalus glaber TaxID=10181 RepID=G5AKG1_HETGA|nr:hypothetical protein GW7_05694 [Heterocephalus glaber]